MMEDIAIPEPMEVWGHGRGALQSARTGVAPSAAVSEVSKSWAPCDQAAPLQTRLPFKLILKAGPQRENPSKYIVIRVHANTNVREVGWFCRDLARNFEQTVW